MFFHRIERLKNFDTMKRVITNLTESDDFTVIPLVQPTSAVGQLLMDPEQSDFLSEYSGEKVNIYYTDKDKMQKFPDFITLILSLVRSNFGKEVKNSCLLIFFPFKTELAILEMVPTEPRKFRSFMFQVIDALQSGELSKNINRLSFELKFSHFAKVENNLIDELFKDVIRFFA